MCDPDRRPTPGYLQSRAAFTVQHVVAHITEGSAYDKAGNPFRRRNYRPGIAAAVAMFALTALVWAFVLTRPVTVGEAAACNAPPATTDPAAPRLGGRLSSSALIDLSLIHI